MLAEEVFFLCGTETGVAIGRTHYPELVWIGAEFRFQQKTIFQRLACVFSCEHAVGLGLAQVKVASVPGLVVGECIVGR